jgi:hypothetical protein
MATKKTATKKAPVTLTPKQRELLTMIADSTYDDGGLLLSNPGRVSAAHKLAALGLVQVGHHETVKLFGNGNARVKFTPAFRITKAGRSALAKAAA